MALGVPAGRLWVAMRIPSPWSRASREGGEVHDQLCVSLAVDCLQIVIALISSGDTILNFSRGRLGVTASSRNICTVQSEF